MAKNKIKIKQYLLEVDIEKTKEMYEVTPSIAESCGCSDCIKLDKVLAKNPNKYQNDFTIFGIDLRKALDIFIEEDQNNFVKYFGIYHVVGDIKNDCDCWMEIGNDRTWTLNLENMIEFENGRYGFTNRVSLRNENWPDNIIQMEIELVISKKDLTTAST